MIKRYLHIIFSFFIMFLLISCEKPIDLKIDEIDEEIVVEATIENGLPPVVILTKTLNNSAQLGISNADGLFVHNAEVKLMTNKGDTVDLVEYNSSDLPLVLKEILYNDLGIDTNLIFWFYGLQENNIVLGEFDTRYDLEIKVGNKKLKASTSIPPKVELTNLSLAPALDGYWKLIGEIDDPDTLGNYYRYFTSTNFGLYTPGLVSVFEDIYFNSQKFEFPIDKGIPRNEVVDPAYYGLFQTGDTITVRWCHIDKNSFNFWRSAETQLGNAANPFAPITRIQSNILGGYGYFIGYSASYHTIVVE